MKRIAISLLSAGSLLCAQDAAVSMHMNLHQTVSGDIQVSEVRVPTGAIWKNTYYESIGIRSNESLNVGHGYAGIQESSDSRGNRVHIFSLWDESGVNYVPHLGYGMETETFGGEGNGSKTWCLTSDESHPLYWQPDVWYTHVIRAWDVGGHTHYGFFMRDGVSGKWRHLSTIGMPHANIRINSGSKNDAFLENWTENPQNGSYHREVHLRNSMRRDLSGNWEIAQKAYYSVNSWDFTDATKRSWNWKTNWDGGIASDNEGSYYYMITGDASTTPTAPLSYQTSTFQAWLDLPNSNTQFLYDAIDLNELLFNDLGNGTMEVSWDRDSTTLPQLTYSIEVYDNELLTGTPLVTHGYDNSDPKSSNQPNVSVDTIDISSLDMNNRYYLKVEVTDIFDNIMSRTVAIGNGEVQSYLKLNTPSGGESYMVGDTIAVTWATNFDSTVSVGLTRSGTWIETMGVPNADQGSFTWEIPDTLSTGEEYGIRIVSKRDTTYRDTTDSYFTVTQPDSLHLLLPQERLSVFSFTNEQNSSDNAAANVLDGDSSTIWHTDWNGSVLHPHEIVLEIDSTYTVSGLSYLPRQEGSNGRIGEYEIYVSMDGENWGTAVATGTWSDDNGQHIVFFDSVSAQYVKLVSLSEVNNQVFTSVAELNLFYAYAEEQVVSVANVSSDRGLSVACLSRNQLSIQVPETGLYEITVVGISGRILLKQNVQFNTGTNNFSLADLAIGTQVALLSVTRGSVAIHEKLLLK